MENPFCDVNQPSVEFNDLPKNGSIGKINKKNIFCYFESSDLLFMVPGSIACIISGLCIPVATIIYGKLFSKISDFSIYDISSNQFLEEIGFYCIMIFVIGMIKLLSNLIACYCWLKNGETNQSRIRFIIFNKFLNHSNIEWIENFNNINGELTQLHRCIEEYRTCNAEVLLVFIQSSVSVCSLFIVAMIFSWSVTLVVFALTPVLFLAGWIAGKFTYTYAEKENLYTSKSSKIINWLTLNPNITRLFNGKDSEMIQFKNLVNYCSKFSIKLQNVLYLNLGLFKTLGLLMFAQGLWFGNTMIHKRKVEINQVFTAFSACLMLADSLSLISEVIGEFHRGSAAVSKIFKFIELQSNEDKVTDGASNSSHSYNSPNFRLTAKKLNSPKMSPTWCNGEIEFKNVSFQYNNKPEVILNNINLKLKSNEFNYIIGKSGSGKSTLSQLIMKFYQPNSGEVLIDGLDIKLVNNSWINRNVTLLQLNPIIFNYSLKENLFMAISDQYNSINSIPENLINDAVDFALLNKLVDKLGSDLNKPTSNLSLSGGEKQRISIARAKLRDTPILIIDEGLSALDYNSRVKLFKKIRDWRQGKTTIFITHQLDQVEHDDYIIVIEEGTIKNQGYLTDLKNELSTEGSHLNNVAYEPFVANLNNQDSMNLIDSDSDYDHEIKYDKEKGLDYNCQKHPMVFKDLQPVESNQKEEIYGLLKILMYFLKTVDAKIHIILGVLMCIIYAVSNPVFSYLFSRLLDNMVDTSIGINRSSDLKLWSCIIIGIAIIHGLSYYLSNFLLSVASERWVNKLRKLCLNKINNQDLSFFHIEKHRPSEINSILMNDTRDLRNMISKFLYTSISLLVLVLLGSIFSLVIGWKLSLVGLAFVLLTGIITMIYARILQVKETYYKDQINHLESISFDMINGIKNIKSLNLSKYFMCEYNKQLTVISNAGNVRAFHVGVSFAVSELVTSIATAVTMYYGLALVGKREYNNLQFLQIISLIIMSFSSASLLLNELDDITRGQRCATYIMKLLNLPSSPIETLGTEIPSMIDKNEILKFSQVIFQYNNLQRKLSLKNINFKISQGDIFGIIGVSGSGKSTIINLITRLYGNYQGLITINNTEISNVKVEWLRDYISIVPQQPVFFEGTIYDNLTYGLSKRKLMNTNINEYLKLCNIYSFVNSLSEGLQSTIGSLTENSLVSSGQLQRLSIVRALVRQPKILILDECTSNLDSQNFYLVKNLIVKLNKELGITVILISHDTRLLDIINHSIHIDHGEVI